MEPISTIIVVKNNPPHIFETIKSVYSISSEILIVDIGIDDQLKKLLITKTKIKIIKITESIPYVELIREKIKVQAKSEYILFLDPDEIVTEQLTAQLKSSMELYDYVKIPRKNIILGKWIQHSRWWPDYQVRFFKKNSVLWPTEIHKQPEVSGKGLTIDATEENAIIHFNYESIDEFMQKALRYAKSEANTYFEKKIELTFNDTIRLSLSEFISRFFAYDGYKDGIHGFIFSFFQLVYPFFVFFYYLELTKFKQNFDEKQLIQSSITFSKGLHNESLYWKDKKEGSTVKEKIVRYLIKQ